MLHALDEIILTFVFFESVPFLNVSISWGCDFEKFEVACIPDGLMRHDKN